MYLLFFYHLNGALSVGMHYSSAYKMCLFFHAIAAKE